MTREGSGAWSDGFGWPGSLHTGPGGKRPGLHGRDGMRPGHHVPRGEPERDLGGDEPTPVDPCIQRWVDEAEEGPEEARPQKRRDEAAPPHVTLREHGQDDGIEETGEDGDGAVSDDAQDQGGPAESAELGDIGLGHARHGYGREEVDRVPDAALEDGTIEKGDHRHRDATHNPALDAGGERMHLDGVTYPMTGLTEPESVDGSRRGRDRPQSLGYGRQRDLL